MTTSNNLNPRFVACLLFTCLSIGCATGYNGYLVMLTGDDWEAHFYALFLAVGGSFGCTGLLWYLLNKIVIRLEPVYRERIAPTLIVGTIFVAFSVGATPTFVMLGHDSGVRLHFDKGVVLYQSALDKANANSRKALAFKNVIRGKVTEISSLKSAAAEGLITGVKGRGEVWRRLSQGENALLAIVSMLEEQEVETNAVIETASTHLQRMRRAIPTAPNVSPLEGLNPYLKAQRAFASSYQQLIESDVRLQIKTALEGLEESIIATDDRRQALNLKRIDSKLKSIAEALIVALDEQEVRTAPLPEWSMGSPVWVCMQYLGHLWQALAIALSIELVPLFWLLACWAQHRQDSAENIDRTTYTLTQLTTLAGALNEVNTVRREASHLQQKLGGRQ